MGSIPNVSVIKGEQRPNPSDYLHHIFDEVADSISKDNIALYYEPDNESQEATSIIQHTFDELRKSTNKIARAILNHINNNQLKPNTDGDFIVAVSMIPTDKLVTTLLAVFKTGAAYLPIDPTFPESRVKHIIGEAKPVMVIYEDEDQVFPGTHAVTFSQLLEEAALFSTDSIPQEQWLQHARDNLALVLYTSGSTGVPKGVRLTHDCVLNRLRWQWRELPYTSTERVCVFKTALTFVDSVCEIWGPLLQARSLLVVPPTTKQDPYKLANLLTKYKIERLVLVPSLLRSLLLCLQLEGEDSKLLHNLSIWVCSGEPLAVSLAKDFFRSFQRRDRFRNFTRYLCNFYGSTEVMGDVTFHVVSSEEHLEGWEKVAIGRPLDNTMVYLLDQTLQPVISGEIGELYVAGLNLAAGYVNGRDPDRFIENPLAVDPMYARLYRTGDFARLLPDKATGNSLVIQYEGRTDSQIKVRGHRVDLAEVERAVAAQPGVEKCIALCHQPGDPQHQALLAFVTPTPGAERPLSAMQLERTLEDVLANYQMPQVIVLEKIPLLVNGKTDRQALLKMYENTNNNDDSAVEVEMDYTGVPAAKMTTAKVLFETVGSVIGRSTRSALTVNSNFFQLGGNSLNSIYTVTQLKEKGYAIGITDFLKAENLGEILDKINPDTEESKISANMSSEYIMESLAEEHKADMFEMITDSFYEKADLEHWLEVSRHDYQDLLEKMWVPLVNAGLSFVARDALTKTPVAVGLNFDAFDEPEIHLTSQLQIVFEFLEYIEGPIRDSGRLPSGKGALLHSFMMATKSSLSAGENVAVMQALEKQVLNVARRRSFKAVLTTNTSPLTQQLGRDVFEYETLLDYQVNEYVAEDGTRPFGRAPDSQRAVVAWKLI